MEPNTLVRAQCRFFVGKAAATVREGGRLWVPIINPTKKCIKIPAGAVLGVVEVLALVPQDHAAEGGPEEEVGAVQTEGPVRDRRVFGLTRKKEVIERETAELRERIMTKFQGGRTRHPHSWRRSQQRRAGETTRTVPCPATR